MFAPSAQVCLVIVFLPLVLYENYAINPTQPLKSLCVVYVLLLLVVTQNVFYRYTRQILTTLISTRTERPNLMTIRHTPRSALR
jgi:hypothetical protein